ncbi:coniferyl aldehyde dehydrogenase [Paracoccus sp. DMF-8]|uniref:coniferyl aldehyde dehydrogenase n=1 Tax=Paracoccus sp. DMF-8 TaxID=3019445 RepID=UPI0023E4668F|nr:coniferyl aldehyde dehydrogenase [Paracoccus sp. DMF-8]MDF3607695.1 coniferyl aldehyde dehydrogenase [Paracoccus sp. DMF-8]
MQDQFTAMRAASRAGPAVPHKLRDERLQALHGLVMDNRQVFGQAISQDFGQRPQAETDLAEVTPILEELREARRHMRRWMARRRVPVGRWFHPARAWVQPQPLGLIGIVAPWNYPLQLAVAPLICAFAAGNRAMVKLSEHTPAFSAAFAHAVRRDFDPDVLSVVTGDAGVASEFCALPFDHLLFTGSTSVGRKVMAAAAPNLTPVTLELGGKSPVLIAPDARFDHAVARIMAGKMLNAGQTCTAPDYVLLPRGREQDFIAAARRWVARHYPKLAANPDYTRIINAAQFARLTDALDQAKQGGALLHPLTDAEPDPGRRLMPPIVTTLTTGPLSEDEIFGPILPLVPYDTLREAVADIIARPRPLAFYPFTESAETRDLLLSQVVAGGVSVNDTLFHVVQTGLPFGGVGASGMGVYHGRAGFDRMSHLMPVFAQSRLNGAGLIAPPYGARFRNVLRWMMR